MSLQSDIQSVIDNSGAEVGLSILHLETDEAININADQVFPMCSVLKIPVLCEAFRQIHEGQFSLDDCWELTLAEKNIPSGVLVFLQDGLMLTVRDLLTLMIIISDNTATDMVMHRVGTDSINQFMHNLGLNSIHVPMTIRDMFDDLLGEASDPRHAFTNLDTYQESSGVRRDGRSYSLGPDNDVSTPREMTQLLAMIFRGEIVSREACNEMLHILLQQQLNDRLPRFLPEGVPFAHKTGTLSGLQNDSGILYANDHSHVAITLYSRWDDLSVEDDPIAERKYIFELENAFGEIGRLVYNNYK